MHPKCKSKIVVVTGLEFSSNMEVDDNLNSFNLLLWDNTLDLFYSSSHPSGRGNQAFLPKSTVEDHQPWSKI